MLGQLLLASVVTFNASVFAYRMTRRAGLIALATVAALACIIATVGLGLSALSG